MTRFSLHLGGLLLVALTGCSANVETEAAQTEDALGDRVGRDQLSTTEPGITLLDGYNPLFDQKRTRCVRPVEPRQPTIGQAFQQTTIKFVRSDLELARELGVDTTFALKSPLASAQGSASLIRSFKGSTTNVNYLIQSLQSYTVQSNGEIVLTDQASELLRARPSDFLVRCGDRFVSGVVYQAKIEALLTFETQSEETAQALQGTISGGATQGLAELNGSISAKLTDASKRNGVSTTISVTAQGFDISGHEGLVGLGGDVEERLARIDSVAGQMGSSLRADRDRDISGFAENTVRSAIPASVQLTRYGDASNAPSALDTSPAFKKHQEMHRRTETFLRAFGQLGLKMDHAYRYEIRPFLDAGPESQATYNLMPPAAPKRYSSELRPVAALWADRFQADDGLDVGTETLAMHEAIAKCVENAKLGDFSDCHPSVDPLTLPVYRKASAVIDEYVASGRIVKLRQLVMESGAEQSYKSARAMCADVGGWVNRLPTAEEAARLAPLVAGWGGGQTKSVWTDQTSACAGDDAMPSFSNPLEGESSTCCERSGFFSRGARSVVCVPQSGPVGKRDEL